MSSYLAVATVSAVLQRMLTPTVSAMVPGAEVWVDRPDVLREAPGVNIYLHRASIDPARRTEGLPARRGTGTTHAVRSVTLSRHYLLTFHGRDDELVPQRLLGASLATLHSQPVVSRTLIDAVTTEAAAPQGTHPYLASSDLADAEELVRVTPETLTVDELARLWSIFSNVPYQLSTACLASPVLLEEGPETQPTAPSDI